MIVTTTRGGPRTGYDRDNRGPVIAHHSLHNQQTSVSFTHHTYLYNMATIANATTSSAKGVTPFFTFLCYVLNILYGKVPLPGHIHPKPLLFV